MTKRNKKIRITLTYDEALILSNHLAGLIGKGSLSTTPSWARKIIGKIMRAEKVEAL